MLKVHYRKIKIYEEQKISGEEDRSFEHTLSLLSC